VVLFSDATDPSRCAPRGPGIHVLISPRLDELSVDRVFARVMQAAERFKELSTSPSTSVR
jgi:hypothetical protein